VSVRVLRRAATGCAPGKVILLGEHAVVYGGLAIAGSIDRQLIVRVRWRAPGEMAQQPQRLRDALRRAGAWLHVDTSRLEVAVDGDLPAAVGLGSSAALDVALLRAVAALARRRPSSADICAAAFALERLFHGTPSGVDNTTATYGGLIAFRNGAFRRIARPAPLRVVVALGGSPRATETAVAAVRARRKRNPTQIDAVIAAIDALACQAEPALESGRDDLVGRLMRCNHELLRTLGVSTPELDAMVELGHRRGALGAKLTGGGGGGAVVCLPADDGSALVEAFQQHGWRAFLTHIEVSREDSHAPAERPALADAPAQQ